MTCIDRFQIWNTHTDKLVETHDYAIHAMRACRVLNEHNVEWNKSFPRCIVIDSLTRQKFYTDLEHKV